MEQEIQAPIEELTPEEAKASLGLSTRLSEQLLMAQNGGMDMEEGEEEATEAPIEPQEAQGEELESEDDKEPEEVPEEDFGKRIAEMELNLMKKLDEVRKELKDDRR